ncbi:putative L-lysine 2,3-aminomutase [Enhygromyxa salina]|uniref:Putative L-lysine 2,3-aminomutase n=1 Tax=Enhygromyxa salina TaxID=215803 RepID=A0A2S9XLW1_9BACT|nr:lysine 2,3-aminomutase [Enhygromyxa salina]PRP93827.1 putative L-lysine 2,3-aminomutase [Enhygromyxa salina]
MPDHAESNRYRAITRANINELPEWRRLPEELRDGLQVVSAVLPFKTNAYVVRELIDWDRVPDDPIFALTFLQREMLDAADYAQMAELVRSDAPKAQIKATADEIRGRLSPHPAGQMTHNVPSLGGRALAGMQHKYRETVLFFPAQGQTCHAYCTFCFRWAQFVGNPSTKFESRETADLTAYLRAHPEVREVLVTGGDPMVMKAKVLARYLEPLLTPEFEHIDIRIGTKSVAYWPQRFVTDADADPTLRLFERITANGRHLAIMGHYSHPRELSTEVAQRAVARIRSTGAQIRMQSPLIRRVNDDPEAWAQLWRAGVRLGCIPYYMFVERDTGPKRFFEVPLVRAWEVFRAAYQRVSGLARTVRGPTMSAFPGKVLIDGVAEIAGERVFALQLLQARNPSLVRQPFYAKFDPQASWFSDLRPAFGAEQFFFESASESGFESGFESGPREGRGERPLHLEIVH